ncbi:DUF4038 domain-containing protein [Pseudaminobacter soli (ex Li et al. 2025)]|uniref:DUF4038 domain-containing protein n=1 Tax=Pseudaminobacter soli (ex Li et al. 2025) TaxID=1295366 RepID=A0A2P7S825_9HYPH|nr:DUF4038 domain-containing protein [Mesorhizobium soli]PSJ58642.1 hypothetical protein C7I85_19335 [Mesorhizobium soli]
MFAGLAQILRRLSRARGILLTACILLIGAFSAGACGTASDHSQAAFPLQVQPDKRYLLDAAGRPFFINGDAGWSLVTQLTREDAEIYLQNRKSLGFNTLLVNLLEHRFADRAPANIYRDKPFKIDGDFATPNEAYFAHADWVLRRACELGFLVLLAPSYTGHDGGNEGWYQEMVRSGKQKLLAYGRFVGKRYAGLDNILWVEGGDYNPPEKDLVRAVAQGISETDPGALHTAHNAPETAALDYWRGEPWLKVNNVYTYDPVWKAATDQYLRGGNLPFFLIESAYENEHDTYQQRVRMQAYQAVLSGASGHVFGNNPIWHFDGPGLYQTPVTWKEALDGPGSQSMSQLGAFISSVKWWLLEPDVDGKLLIAGQGGEEAHVSAARAKDGSFAVVYLPTSEDVTLDLGQLAGQHIAARWRDPTNGKMSAAEGSPFVAGPQTFRPPRRTEGGSDWILELTAEEEQSQ